MSEAQSYTYTQTTGSILEKGTTITDEFGFALNDLHSVIEALTIRLQPVLKPLGPQTGDASDPMPPVSEIRDKLNSLHYASGEVRRLLDRLDI